MPTFNVTLYFEGVIETEVKADSSGEAERIATDEAYESLQAARITESFSFTSASVEEIEEEE